MLGIVIAVPFVQDFAPGGKPPLTVGTKLMFALNAPSLALTVMVALPVLPTTGETVTVRLLPLPPKKMFASGTNEGLDEAPLTDRFPAGDCASPTVKSIGPTGVPSS